MNFLFCSVADFVELMKIFRKSLDGDSKIIAAGNSNTQPALYFSDKQYIVPNITDQKYIPAILDICNKENVKAVMTVIDPEIEILAKNRQRFRKIGVEVLVPSLRTAKLCFDKYKMYQYLKQNEIKTITTYKDLNEFSRAQKSKKCDFPVFVKPRMGWSSKRARKISNYDELECVIKHEDDVLIQEFIEGQEFDVDVYVDLLSHKAVSIFSKKKLLSGIGGTKRSLSYIDEKLYSIVEDIISKFEFHGAVDMEFFLKDGEYYLIEVNPRFSAAYPHAYVCGVDFIKLIINNLNGIENSKEFGNYDEGAIMMKYESAVIKKKEEVING
jgi:carbamoyl-phosphate synthase large subunit